MKNVQLLLALLMTGSLLQAQDGLYAPVLPGDTALVRLVNAGTDGSIAVDIGTTRIESVPPGAGSPYYPVRPGVYVVFARGHREALTVTSGTFHTVVVAAEGISVFEDRRHDDPLRTQLILYNVTSVPVRLDAVMPEAPLLGVVAPGDTDEISVNAIPVTIAVRPDGTSGPEPDPDDPPEISLSLTRGDSYAVVATGGAHEGAIAAFVVKASVVAAPGAGAE